LTTILSWLLPIVNAFRPLPKNQEVLFKAIESGILSGEYFAYADGQDVSGRYEALCLGNTPYLHITLDGLLVKSETAKAQIEKEKVAAKTASTPDSQYGGTASSPDSGPGYNDIDLVGSNKPQSVQSNKPTHFYGSVELDLNKIAQNTGTINQEVLQHFHNLGNAEIIVKLDIQVNIPDGIADDLARTIRENCRTLKFETNDFE
jgi:hypothetical protein